MAHLFCSLITLRLRCYPFARRARPACAFGVLYSWKCSMQLRPFSLLASLICRKVSAIGGQAAVSLRLNHLAPALDLKSWCNERCQSRSYTVPFWQFPHISQLALKYSLYRGVVLLQYLSLLAPHQLFVSVPQATWPPPLPIERGEEYEG